MKTQTNEIKQKKTHTLTAQNEWVAEMLRMKKTFNDCKISMDIKSLKISTNLREVQKEP